MEEVKVMRKAIAIAAICLGGLLAGCGTSNVHSVQGTVSRVGAQDGNFGQREKRFIQLKGSDTLYTCWVENVPRCSVVREGDQVSLGVGHNEDYDIDNFVVSVDGATDIVPTESP